LPTPDLDDVISADGLPGAIRGPISHHPAPLLSQTLFIPMNGLALQLLFLKASESMGNHDSEVVGACSVD
jgi:hypothetical protein